MHITIPRTLGLLTVLALIGYAFFIGPWINAAGSTRPPSSSVTVPKVQPSGVSRRTEAPVTKAPVTEAPAARVTAVAPRATSQAPHPRAE